MTDYERLALAMSAAGLSGTIASARRLADRSWFGSALTDTEAKVVAAWEAATAAAPFSSSCDRKMSQY